MLGGEAFVFVVVEFGFIGGGNKCFEDGCLAIAVDVRVGVGDGGGKAFAEASVVDLVGVFSSGDDDAIGSGR